MVVTIQDSLCEQVIFKFHEFASREGQLISTSTVGDQMEGRPATTPPSTQGGGNDEVDDEQRRKSPCMSDELLWNTLLQVPFAHPRAEPLQIYGVHVVFPCRRYVQGENAPFSAITGLVTTSSRGVRHLGGTPRGKTGIQPKIHLNVRNRGQRDRKEDTIHRLCGHKRRYLTTI